MRALLLLVIKRSTSPFLREGCLSLHNLRARQRSASRWRGLLSGPEVDRFHPRWAPLAAFFNILLVAMLPSLGAVAQQSTPDYAADVNPFIGTAPSPSAAYGLEFDGGDVFPGAVYPSGMLAWSPDTVEHRLPGGYDYADRTLKGFSLTHFSGRGCTVYQDVPIMPVAGDLTVSPRAQPDLLQATFSHANESASPGAYGVTLDNGIDVQLAATPRTGLGVTTFPQGLAHGTLVVDAGGSVNDVFDSQVMVDPDRQLITGSVVSQVGCGDDHYTLYFAIAFDRPFLHFGTWSESKLQPSTTSTRAPHTGVYATFDLSAGTHVTLKPAISYVSIDNALANLQVEDAGWDLNGVQGEARAAWNTVLGQVTVEGGSAADSQVFYTALYHAFLEPNLFSDANGQYLGFDDQVHQVAAGHSQYANIAGWDQYRALIQLRALLDPSGTSDILQSLVDDATQGGGGMPRWEQANRNSAGMVGDSPAVLIANGYAFGARDFDTPSALAALDLGASDPGATSGGHPVREYLDPWVRLGYVPDQPSISLEYATDDFSIAQFAHALGREDVYDRYAARAANWSNTFNPATGYVESRDVSGTFMSSDHSQPCCGFVEGNAAQYTWMVPFDYPGLFARMGGTDAAVRRLDDFFSEVNAGPNRAHAWLGNEPTLGAAWAYDFAGAPGKTQRVVRRVQRELFDATPGGLPGNDDGGTLSAWYVFAALGLYPAVPGVGGFAVGSPLFSNVDVHLPDGHALHVTSDGADEQSLTVDGVPLDGAWLEWSRVSHGATLGFATKLSPQT
jgi:predicted alpha-1,2-mannosidase